MDKKPWWMKYPLKTRRFIAEETLSTHLRLARSAEAKWVQEVERLGHGHLGLVPKKQRERIDNDYHLAMELADRLLKELVLILESCHDSDK